VVSGRVECPESLHLAACLQRFLSEDGCVFVPSREEADIIVLNGCERIAETPEVVAALLHFATRHPEKTVLCTGCVPRAVAGKKHPANFFLVPFWKLVRQPSLIGPAMGFSSSFALLPKDDIFHGCFPLEEHYPGNPQPEEVALLTVGSGCLGACTFCTIRRGRGKVRSVPLNEMIEDARAALNRGSFRFVLIADDAGCWGLDLGLDLSDLLTSLAALSSQVRFFIRPMNPNHFLRLYERIVPLMPRIDCIYLPLQSASDRILGLMRRGHTAQPVLERVQQLRSAHPHLTFKTDFIVGFPSETREEFRASVHAAQLFHHASFHRFLGYPGTVAAGLPDKVPEEEIDLRVEVCRRLGFTIVDPSTYAYDLEGDTP